MATPAQRTLELAEAVEQYPLGKCGPSDDPDKQTAYLYGFKDVAKRFVAYARRFDDKTLKEMLDGLDVNPECITDAYDLRADLIPIIDYLKELKSLDGPRSEPTATRDIAFISYSTVDKEWGGYIRRTMEFLGVSTFIAHDDLKVSEEWQKRILQELERTDIFIALLSKAFKDSEWCPQELGYIVGFRDVLVIPLSIDGTNPYGFISHLQGHQLKSKGEVESALTDVLLRERPRLAVPKAIQRVAGAGGFRDAEARMGPLVPHFSSFTMSEAEDFARAAMSTGQVWDAALCRDRYLPMFLEIWGSRIPDLRDQLWQR